MIANPITITAAATAVTAVTIKPVPGEAVTFEVTGRAGFDFANTAAYLTLEGVELYGTTDQLDFWCVVGQSFWGDETIPRGGGLAVILDGQYITVKDNYIHDFYQKAVEIRDGRYVEVVGNIIHHIATTSISGGHGIMRQQKGQEFFTDDVPGTYRWDIRENLLFNVEQRIYSWVPSKGFIEMVIDEGKSILIDDPADTDGVQEQMSARIRNNIVAFGSVDHIRLKSTPNLEVSNNSTYSTKTDGDGITDKVGDTATPQFTNFIGTDNACQGVTRVVLEMDDAIAQSAGNETVERNYAAGGRTKPRPQGVSNQPQHPGMFELGDVQLFVDPENGDFTINPALALPASVGVQPVVQAAINAKVTQFGVPFVSDPFVVDHLKLTQSILDNVPGLNDGIVGNETVFTDYGTMSANYHTITFDVVMGGDWQQRYNSPATQDFELNEVYYTWYASVADNYPDAGGGTYERIRWGCSEVKQDQVFDPDWLTVSQITGAGENTLINGMGSDFVLDGDLLIDFELYAPAVGETFDLMVADNITSANVGQLFDRVLFEGHTPDNYSLTIESVGGVRSYGLPSYNLYPLHWWIFGPGRRVKRPSWFGGRSPR